MSKKYMTFVVVYQEDEEINPSGLGLGSEIDGGIICGMAIGDEMVRAEKLEEALFDHDPSNPALSL